MVKVVSAGGLADYDVGGYWPVYDGHEPEINETTGKPAKKRYRHQRKRKQITPSEQRAAVPVVKVRGKRLL